ncbi:MAG TPA: NUDIX hydrolase [Jatrophihabitantaceae bacterium]|nr:NUDIX hydrolase [Jatrophihabitantaceae bacterium]
MLSAGWLIVAVLFAVLLTAWVTFTVTRLDRLHARVDAAQAALDAQLVRRVAALLHVVESGDSTLPTRDRERYESVARSALVASGDEREAAENEVGRAVVALVDSDAVLTPEAGAELGEAAARVVIARRFYNDAVRDTRSLRARRMPRLMRLAGRRELPKFFDIDDTVPSHG